MAAGQGKGRREGPVPAAAVNILLINPPASSQTQEAELGQEGSANGPCLFTPPKARLSEESFTVHSSGCCYQVIQRGCGPAVQSGPQLELGAAVSPGILVWPEFTTFSHCPGKKHHELLQTWEKD
ncbi:hypothetical protein DUI87_20288 [Hirundo rustica rustica]|uniref:Uncharacterized protein n=1 Tax=Hirundo rustica rustica TaxID=333673 RepID=A0A3M0JQU8_HIRRU|nr:hypothetical protein DUI87_20288 [Hirundo rustica rustica]